GGVGIWKIDGPTPTFHFDIREPMRLFALAFHPDGRRLALGHNDGTVSVYELDTKTRLKRVTIGRVPATLAFHPSKSRLAAACGDSVRIVDVDSDSGNTLQTLELPKAKAWWYGIAWHPEGRLLAATCDDTNIHIWDTETGREAMPPLEGHVSGGIYMAFN